MSTSEAIVRCAYCGFEIGRITFTPGSQVVGCSQCKGITKVVIFGDGEMRTDRHVHPNKA